MSDDPREHRLVPAHHATYEPGTAVRFVGGPYGMFDPLSDWARFTEAVAVEGDEGVVVGADWKSERDNTDEDAEVENNFVAWIVRSLDDGWMLVRHTRTGLFSPVTASMLEAVRE